MTTQKDKINLENLEKNVQDINIGDLMKKLQVQENFDTTCGVYLQFLKLSKYLLFSAK